MNNFPNTFRYQCYFYIVNLLIRYVFSNILFITLLLKIKFEQVMR